MARIILDRRKYNYVMVHMQKHNYSLFVNPLKYKHNQLQFAISYAYVCAVSSSKKRRK